MSQIDILAVFAHPDDMELYVSGTMLKMKHLGYRTGALDITRGEMGTRGTVEARAVEAANAAEMLDLDLRENLGLRDGHVFVGDDERVKLVRALRKLKPKVILTHQSGDTHPDHDHIATLVRECSRLVAMRNYDPETGDQKFPPPIVAHAMFSRRITPSFIVDISDFLDRRMEAIKAHRSQFFDPNSTEPETMLTGKDYLDDIMARARYFGQLIGVRAGEPFYVHESLNVHDPVDLLSRSMNLYS